MNDVSNSQLMELMVRARKGDEEAIVGLLGLYRNYLLLMARLQIDSSLHGKVSASDVAQESFTRAKRHFAQFHGVCERELLVWLRRNLASTMARTMRYTAQKREVKTARQLDEQLEASSQALSRLPVVNSSSAETGRRDTTVTLADALAQLDAVYREVLVLRHLERMSFPEIAQRMGRSVDSVKDLWACGVVDVGRYIRVR